MRARSCRAIGKDIIGHPGLFVRRKRRFAGRRMRAARRVLALLNQPASQQGASIFLQPLIEQRANLFTEIGRVAQAREFVTMQRIWRSRKKKLPRRFILLAKHGASEKLRDC